MKIISGKYRGLKLISPSDDKIRPTSVKVKESIFSIIESQKYSNSIENKNFLDICSGTGSIALEAYSRGAKIVYLLELSRISIITIKKNINRLNLSNQEKKKLILLKADVLKLDNIIMPKFDFIYIDPPYKKDYTNIILDKLFLSNLLKKETLIFFETDKIFEDNFNEYQLINSRKYGDTYIHIIKLKVKFF